MNWFGDIRGRASAKGHVQRAQRQAPSSVTAAHQGQRERARDPPARANSPGAVCTPLGSEGWYGLYFVLVLDPNKAVGGRSARPSTHTYTGSG